MELKEFHIKDFPENKVRILIKNHKEFIENIIKTFGSRKELANFLDVNPELITMWKNIPLYISLHHIRKIVDEINLDWKDIEKNIDSYKGLSTGIPIKNPILPIKESSEIFELITHIICDGCVNKNGIPFYINSNKKLIENFRKMLNSNFGDIKGKLYTINKNNKKCYEYRFPKIITELLNSWYDLNNFKKLPNRILNLPVEFSVAVIRAFADDEGTVDLNRRIGFHSINKDILKFLKRLLQDKLGYKNVGDVNLKDRNYYYFYIKSKDIDKYEREIGFIHGDKKRILREIIKHKRDGYKPGQHGKKRKSKEMILKLLSNKKLSTYDLIKKLKINKSNINIQIKKLRDEELIVQQNKIGQTVFWTRRK